MTSPYTFTVNTLAPTVTLTQPASPSNDTTPSFTGTASDTTPVTVDVYAGEKAEGNPISILKVQGTGGSWASASVSPPLQDGTLHGGGHTAKLVRQPARREQRGDIRSRHRIADRDANAPPSRSNDRMPSFSGTASETTQVTVEIFEGTRPEGSIVATATAPGTRGSWISGDATPALPSGRHTFTAFATQASEIGNAAGRSAPVTFVVDTEPPTVTLQAPPSPSSDTTPSFSGTASEATPVTVEIFEGHDGRRDDRGDCDRHRDGRQLVLRRRRAGSWRRDVHGARHRRRAPSKTPQAGAARSCSASTRHRPR